MRVRQTGELSDRDDPPAYGVDSTRTPAAMETGVVIFTGYPASVVTVLLTADHPVKRPAELRQRLPNRPWMGHIHPSRRC
jgi:hypothetical protein